jgi:hypothetical protein
VVTSTIAAGILRTVAVATVDLTDVTNSTSAYIFCIAELTVAIIIASSAIMRPIFDQVFRTFTSITEHGESQSLSKKGRQSIVLGHVDDMTRGSKNGSESELKPRIITQIEGDATRSVEAFEPSAVEEGSVKKYQIFVSTSIKQ